MSHRLPLVLCLVCLAGCRSQPVTTITETPRTDLFNRGSSHYVENRTAELQRMGGPFKDKDVAEQKARQEMNSLFGEPKVVYSSAWGKKSPQAELNESLDDMKRDKDR